MKQKEICGIYKITSPSNKIYIGQSINIYKRFNFYKLLHCKHQTKLFNSLNKYGYDNHRFEIIIECNECELNNLEKYYVDLFNTFNSKYGLNLKDGGGHKGKHSEETKLKIGEASKNRFHSKESKLKNSLSHKGKLVSEETKLKMSLRLIGNVYNLGKKASIEARKNMSFASKGKKKSDKAKLNMSLCKKGIPLSEEHKRKLSEAQKLRRLNEKKQTNI